MSLLHRNLLGGMVQGGAWLAEFIRHPLQRLGSFNMHMIATTAIGQLGGLFSLWYAKTTLEDKGISKPLATLTIVPAYIGLQMLWGWHMKNCCRSQKMMKVCEGVASPEERANVLARLNFLIDENMTDLEANSIIDAVAAVPAGERLDVLKKLDVLLADKEVDASLLAEAIQAIAAVPVEERSDMLSDMFEKIGALLLDEKVDGSSLVQIIQTIAAVPAGERSDMLEKIGALLMDKEADGSSLVQIVQAIAAAPVGERADLIGKVDILLAGREVDGSSLARTIQAVAAVPVGERSDVLEKVDVLLTDKEVDDPSLVQIIQAVAAVSAGERSDVLRGVGTLFNDVGNGEELESLEIVRIIQVVAKVPADEREDVLQKAKDLVSKTPDRQCLGLFLSLIAKIPVEERGAVVSEAVQSIQHIPLEERSVAIAIDIAGKAIPQCQREEIIKDVWDATLADDKLDESERLNAFAFRLVNRALPAYFGEEGGFILTSSDWKHPLLLLSRLFSAIQQNEHQLPKILSIDSEVIDAGGVTRQLLTKLFRSILGNPLKLSMRDEEGSLIPKIDPGYPQVSKEKQIECFQAIGSLFALALHNKNFTTGKYFHPALFNMIYALSSQEIAAIPSNLANIADIPLDTSKKLLELLLQELYPGIDHASIDWTEYPEINQMCLAVAVIAKSMQEQLKKMTKQDWEQIKGGSSDGLSRSIQGQISPDIVKNALVNQIHAAGVDASETKAHLTAWIDAATPKQLEQFVEAATGSSSILPGGKIFLSAQLVLDTGLPEFHTCGRSVVFRCSAPKPGETPEQRSQQFNDRLNESLGYLAAGGMGFQIA